MWQWEQDLLDAYYDYRWRETLNPRYGRVPALEGR